MVNNNQDCWVFGLLFIVRYPNGRNVSETGYVCVPLPHLKTDRDPLFETLCLFQYQTMDNAQNQSNSQNYTLRNKIFKINTLTQF